MIIYMYIYFLSLFYFPNRYYKIIIIFFKKNTEVKKALSTIALGWLNANQATVFGVCLSLFLSPYLIRCG